MSFSKEFLINGYVLKTKLQSKIQILVYLSLNPFINQLKTLEL